MRYQQGESYEDWAERVRRYEHGEALKQIAAGMDADAALERMARRISEKMLAPILQAIRESRTPISKEDLEKSKQEYYDNYISKIPKRPDQMGDFVFDKK